MRRAVLITLPTFQLREVVGDFGTLVMTAHEWHDVEIDKRSMRLLAEEVMPRFSQHMLALRGA